MSSIVVQPNLPMVLRNLTKRLSTLEGEVGRWIYVLPMSPATPPQDFNADDPLSPSFVNGWGNVAGQQPASFRMHPATVVQLRGAIQGGTIPSIVFTLPEQYRPTQGPVPVTFPSSDGSLVYTGLVDVDGDVHILAELSTSDVTSISKSGSSPLTGDVTLSPGGGVSITQTGQDIQIAALVTSVFGRTGAVAAATGDYYGVVAAALTGATATSRYVGATAGGAPVTGTFQVGDWIIDRATPSIYICTVAGSPGTWVAIAGGGGGGVTSLNSLTGAVTLAAGSNVSLSQVGQTIQIAASGGGSGSGSGGTSGTVLFDQTLLYDTPMIDTGPGAILPGYKVIEVWIIARTDAGSTFDALDVTVNGDTGNNYDSMSVQATNATPAGASTIGNSKWSIDVRAAGSAANYASAYRASFPGYDQTTFLKTGEISVSNPDSAAASSNVGLRALGWRSAVPINRMAIKAAGSSNLKAGSRLLIVGVSPPVVAASLAAGDVLDYGQRSTDYTTSTSSDATATAILTANPITFDGLTVIEIEFWCMNLNNPGSRSAFVNLFLDGVDQGRMGASQSLLNGAFSCATAPFIAPGGTHTYSLRGWCNSGTVTFNAAGGGTATNMPMFYKVTVVKKIAFVASPSTIRLARSTSQYRRQRATMSNIKPWWIWKGQE